MRLVIDIDGVLRDLHSILIKEYNGGEHIVDWHQRYLTGDTVYTAVKKDMSILVRSTVTKYFDVISRYIPYPELWSHQPDNWIPYTIDWLNQHFYRYKLNLFTVEQKQERLNNLKDVILIDDCPLFTDYSRILLIDAPYNQEVKVENRIKSPEELEVWLEKYVEYSY